ncbi:MAG: DUF1501 domain-containing protein [Pseudomonadota bacterium]|nr:DUF1501 domain-containing protein [Pseudomonadota bacterium]
MTKNLSRRNFVHMSVGALASTAALGTFGGLGKALAATADTSGYKALVCVFLYGGNSSFNWVVPTSNAKYEEYRKARSSLALAQNSLLPLNGTAGDGHSYGLHPNCTELQHLFNTDKAAVICNVGTLVRPVTRVQARGGSIELPPQLFSHIDQQTQWMTSFAQSPERYGWAGRVADLYASQGATANLAFNIDVGGVNYWQEGRTSIPYVLGANGAPALFVTADSRYRNGLRQRAAQTILDQAAKDPNKLVQQLAGIERNAADKESFINAAFSAAGDLRTPFPVIPGDGGFGAQLHEVARCIKAHSHIGDARQMFFVQLSGFDTHNAELATHGSLMKILSENLNTFYKALGEIGMQNEVTTFTASDFGRTLGANTDGSDHAWGGHSLVLGGAVRGGKYYGTMPSLVINGESDIGNGRIIPTTSTDQYMGTLARWFGVGDSSLDAVFPNLANFKERNLGFLG